MIKAKKSLGQNWLKSESAIKEIIKAADLVDHKTKPHGNDNEWILEVGPGRGALTEKLLDCGCKVIAVEKDDRLITDLQEKFAKEIAEKKLILIHDDILKIDFSKTIDNLPETKFRDKNMLGNKGNYKLVANIPYYITGQVIRKFLSEEEKQPSRMVLMLQKEVAKRIVATDHRESLLSLSVKVYGQPKYIKTVPAGAFEPKPKVDSAILLIENISRNFFRSTSLNNARDKSLETDQKLGEKKFFDILKKGFGQKRKLLKSNLGVSEEVLSACQIPLKARAENLTLENWGCLVNNLEAKPRAH